MGKNEKKRVLILVLFLLCIVLGACNTSDAAQSSTEESGEQYKVMFIPKLIESDFYKQAERGAIDACNEFNCKEAFIGPVEADSVEQAKILEDNINLDWDVIVVAPNDDAAMESVVRRAKNTGKVIFGWSTGEALESVDYVLCPIEYEEQGHQMMEAFAQQMGGEGDYAIITGGLNAAELNAYLDAAEEYQKEFYPEMNLVTPRIGTDEKQQICYEKALEVIQAYPGIKGILGLSAPAGPGIGQAIRDKGLQEELTFVTCSAPNMCKDYLKDGSLDINVIFDPYSVGYAAIYLGKLICEGRGDEIVDGMEIPGLGEISIDGKAVVLSEPVWLTFKNYEQYNIDY